MRRHHVRPRLAMLQGLRRQHDLRGVVRSRGLSGGRRRRRQRRSSGRLCRRHLRRRPILLWAAVVWRLPEHLERRELRLAVPRARRRRRRRLDRVRHGELRPPRGVRAPRPGRHLHDAGRGRVPTGDDRSKWLLLAARCPEVRGDRSGVQWPHPHVCLLQQRSLRDRLRRRIHHGTRRRLPSWLTPQGRLSPRCRIAPWTGVSANATLDAGDGDGRAGADGSPAGRG